MIQLIGTEFIAVQHNLAKSPVPDTLPGPALWQKAYSSVWKNRFGYATTAVFSADGKIPLGGSGTINWWNVLKCTNSNPRAFYEYLEVGLKRGKRLVALRGQGSAAATRELEQLRSEILRSLKHGHRGRRRSKVDRGARSMETRKQSKAGE